MSQKHKADINDRSHDESENNPEWRWDGVELFGAKEGFSPA